MKNINVSCKEVMSHICDSLGEDLNSPKCINIKDHLENCPSCQKYFDSVESTISFYKKYNVELDTEGHNRLLSVLGLKEKNG
ncbi:MAG: zf-HC2 domain-containing protein [Melioribacteraceae bacterium]